MNHGTRAEIFKNIDEQIVRQLFKKAGVDHTYRIATSVCSLLSQKFPPSNVTEIGIVTMRDLNLYEDNVYIFQDVVDVCLKMGYVKITVPEIFCYLNTSVNYGSIFFYGPAVALMDEVTDEEGCNGIIFLNSEDNFLSRISFFSPNNSKKISKEAKFLVGKK